MDFIMTRGQMTRTGHCITAGNSGKSYGEKREEMRKKGDFTLPGEAGYEKLTLKLAEKWGADVIRDSDGTVLSKEILNAGYEIYSTICLIRGHNEWAKEHMETVQQTFLMTNPVMAEKNYISIYLMKDFFEDQFKIKIPRNH